jgi:hypothetical protein
MRRAAACSSFAREKSEKSIEILLPGILMKMSGYISGLFECEIGGIAGEAAARPRKALFTR